PAAADGRGGDAEEGGEGGGGARRGGAAPAGEPAGQPAEPVRLPAPGGVGDSAGPAGGAAGGGRGGEQGAGHSAGGAGGGRGRMVEVVEVMGELGREEGDFAKGVLPLLQEFMTSHGPSERDACLVAVVRIRKKHDGLGQPAGAGV